MTRSLSWLRAAGLAGYVAIHQLRVEVAEGRSSTGAALEVDEARYGRLVDLYEVRNALAHANGLREGMSGQRWRRLERTLSRHGVELDSDRGVVVLTRAYVERAYNDVSASLRSLVTRARANSSNRSTDGLDQVVR